MPRYRIHMINSEFQSSQEDDFPSVEHALRTGVLAAANIASEQVAMGEANAAIEIRVEKDDQVLAPRIVTFSISDLAIGE